MVLDKDDGNVFVKPEVVILRKGACFGVCISLRIFMCIRSFYKTYSTTYYNKYRTIDTCGPS